jgi:diaminopimelate epimerase
VDGRAFGPSVSPESERSHEKRYTKQPSQRPTAQSSMIDWKDPRERSMQTLRFGKYEGAGNDFLLIEAESDRLVTPEQATRLCDRHFGVGGDGVLLILPPLTPGAKARMLVLNADGSRPEMCGNGLRCVALYLAERDGVTESEFVVDTDAGPRATQVDRRNAQAPAQVTLGMGRARLVGKRSFVAAGAEREFVLVDMGNPHAIAFETGVDVPELDRVGPALSGSTPGGTNVEVVSARAPGVFDVLVWERGVGRTLACGTGAAAVAAAAVATERAEFDTPIEVRLPGGALTLTVEKDSLEVTLRGPARHVFSGQVSA